MQPNNTSGTLRTARAVESVEYEGFEVDAAFLEFTDVHGRACSVYAEQILLPEGAPAIVHCPGGGQTVNRADLIDWAHKGFGCVSFDWQIGDFAHHDPQRKSRWPEGVVGQNHYIEREEEAILPLAIAAAGVCIDWLLQTDRVQAKALGVVGISWGGYLAWLVAAYEPRVAAAVPVYGCGGHFDPRHPAPISLGCDMHRRWQQDWDPFSIARRQTKPVCFLSASNDFFGIFTLADDLLNALPVPHRRGILPNCNHSISPAESALGLAWLRHYIADGPAVPAEPALNADFSITADLPEHVDATELWWTPELKAGDLGCWIPGQPAEQWAAVYGRIHYKSGLCMATPLRYNCNNPAAVVPQQSQQSIPAICGIGWNWDMGSTQFHSNAVTLSDLPDGRLRITRDPHRADDCPSFFFNQFAHPGWNTGQQRAVALRVESECCLLPSAATVSLHLHGVSDSDYCCNTLPIQDGELIIELSSFGDAPEVLSWKNVVRCQVQLKTAARSFLISPLRILM